MEVAHKDEIRTRKCRKTVTVRKSVRVNRSLSCLAE